MDKHSLPLIDLHRHLDGNVRLETILDLGRKHNLPLPAWTLEELRPYVQIVEPQPGVMAFIEKFRWMVGVLVDYDACRRAAYENVQDASRENLDYLELRFSPLFMAEPHGLDPEGVVAAVCDGIDCGRRNFKQPVNLIGIISRTYGPEKGWQELNALLTHSDKLVALDLAGDEANFPGELFREHIERGRRAGWKITIHAGEEGGPDRVWEALRLLKADRIGHGISAARDEKLMETLAEKRISLEVSLTSNLQTMVVPDLAGHPMRRFLEKGIPATINTDDPGISGIDLRHELTVAAPAAGLSEEQIRAARWNSLEAAFLGGTQKMELRRKISGQKGI